MYIGIERCLSSAAVWYAERRTPGAVRARQLAPGSIPGETFFISGMTVFILARRRGHFVNVQLPSCIRP